MSLFCDSRDRLWIGSLREGLHLVSDGKLQSFKREQNPSQTITALFEDSKGRIWIGSDEGIYSFEGKPVQDYRLDEQLQRPTIVCFAEDRRTGTIWAGASCPGWCVWRETPFGTCRMSACSLKRKSARCSRMRTAHMDWDQRARVGLSTSGEDFRSFSETRGLRATSIGGITDDGCGCLWLSSERGILRVPRQEFENVMSGSSHEIACQLFDRNDGLPAVECDIGNQPTAVKDAKGRLWFVTAKGIARTDPSSLTFNTEPALLSLEKLW